MKTLKRRIFLRYALSFPAITTLFSCVRQRKDLGNIQANNLIKDDKAMELSKAMTKDQVFAMLDQRVQLTMEKSNNCAQTAFFALSQQFGLGGDDVLKALTPLPGIAERGETCGAVTGALMAMGLMYGRDRMDDWQKYRDSLIPTNLFCKEFECEVGSTLCCEIQQKTFGESYDLMDASDLKAFQRAGATQKCGVIVKKACRFAAEIILTHKV